jgi:hypothetical protein
VHPIVPFARTAYAQGFAASGGPLTEQVKAGCLAAVELAVARADDPYVLEATLQLGALEGTWAAVYQRRQQVHDGNEQTILAAWKALGLATQAGELVTAVRQQAGLTEALRDKAHGVADWVAGLIRRLFSSRVTVDGWHRLATAVTTALNKARAEGQAAALGLAANQQGVIGFSFELAFEDAYRALENASTLTGAAAADGWLSRMLGDAADEIGARLATLTRGGASYDDMIAAASDLLDGATSRSVQAAVDLLTSRAMSQGALDLYRSEGVTHVDFLSAGDGRVCPPCDAAEKRNPYAVGDAPVPGLHARCRCAVVASASSALSADLLARYIDAEASAA